MLKDTVHKLCTIDLIAVLIALTLCSIVLFGLEMDESRQALTEGLRVILAMYAGAKLQHLANQKVRGDK